MDTDDATDISELPARERILRTAHALFYGEGLRATGIDRVIAEAGVTKVTFYRHFPSKTDLILAYLERRHDRWMRWFRSALERHGADTRGVQVLPDVLGEWFRGEGLGDFRGCAFINGVSEMGPVLPAVVDATRQHKQAMTEAIEAWLPPSDQRRTTAEALAMAVDGAIVQVQSGADPSSALRSLALIAQQCAVTPPSDPPRTARSATRPDPRRT